MWQIIGWIIWAVLAYQAVGFAYGCRTYTKSGQGFQWATGIRTFFFWLIVILFLIFDWSKLHILWIAPIAYLAAPFLVMGRIPILSPFVLFATGIFLDLILVGVKKPKPPK